MTEHQENRLMELRLWEPIDPASLPPEDADMLQWEGWAEKGQDGHLRMTSKGLDALIKAGWGT